MDSKEATEEFVRMLRLGSTALQSVLSRDQTVDATSEINEIRFLLDSLDEVGIRLAAKLGQRKQAGLYESV